MQRVATLTLVATALAAAVGINPSRAQTREPAAPILPRDPEQCLALGREYQVLLDNAAQARNACIAKDPFRITGGPRTLSVQCTRWSPSADCRVPTACSNEYDDWYRLAAGQRSAVDVCYKGVRNDRDIEPFLKEHDHVAQADLDE
jgi:hypothetical protein